MEVSELLKKVRRIEIKAKGLINEMFSGDYHSAFKGRGMLFSEVREYQFGDDIRNIDWNVTARFDNAHVKVFEEERELTVMLVIDISGSSHTGGRGQIKREIMAELAAIISFSATQNNDKVGAILFAGDVELFIPPRKGKSHAMRIIRDIIEFEPKKPTTNIGGALKFLNNAIKKKATVFLITDFFDKGFEVPLKLANKKHDLIALRMKESIEAKLPNIGIVPVQDPETGKINWLDTSSRSTRKSYEKESLKWEGELNNFFKKIGLDNTVIQTEGGYIKPLRALFRQRQMKR
jgi:uncharacterized protein (DUF58 family)